MGDLVVFGLFVTAAYYLFARAQITKFAWSRYRGFLDRLARCPACSGFWLGLLLSHWAPTVYPGWYCGLPAEYDWRWALGIVLAGFLGMVLCAVFYGLMHWGLAITSIDTEDSNEIR